MAASSTFFYRTATDAAGADSYFFLLTIDQRGNFLQIRIPGFFGSIVSMTDIIANLWSFSTNITNF